MKLAEIHLEGFGRLANCTYRFGPGLNLVFGPNEAGKSTLQTALVALLYGLLPEGRVKAADRSLMDALQPWGKGISYAGSLTYFLDNGSSFRVSRTFSPRATTLLTTHPDGTDVSDQFEAMSDGRLLFAAEHLGVGKEVFENTCTVRQAELVALDESAQTIIDTLMRLTASATTDTTATEALLRLEEALKEEVGTARARTKPLPQLMERLSRLEGERSQSLQMRRELFFKIVELNQAEDELQRLDQERQRQRYLQLLAEVNVIRQQLAAAGEAAADVSRWQDEVARWQPWAAFPVQLRDDVIRLVAQRNDLQAESDVHRQRAIAAEEQLTKLRQQIVAAEERAQELAVARSTAVAESSTVQQLATKQEAAKQKTRSVSERWERVRSALEESEAHVSLERVRLEAAVSLGHAGLAALQQQLSGAQGLVSQATQRLALAQSEWAGVGMDESQFEQLERTVQEIQSGTRPVPKPRKGCNPLPLRQSAQRGYQTPTELVTYAQVKPIHTKLLQCAAEVDAACQSLAAAEAAIRGRLGGLIGDSLDEQGFRQLAEQLEQHLRAQADSDRQKTLLAEIESERAVAQRDVDAACSTLQAKLTELGFSVPDVQVALDTYLEQCERKKALEREEAGLERLRLLAQGFDRDLAGYEEERRALAETERRLSGLLTQAGIECSAEALEASCAEFQEGAENHGRWASAQKSYEAAVQHQRSLLNAQARVDQETSLVEIETKLAVIRAEYPGWSELQTERTPQAHVVLGQQADEAWATAREVYNQIRESIRQRANNMRHLAEIDEEIGIAKGAIQRLEGYRHVLERARKELVAATQEYQKQFAPRLGLLMSEGVGRITQGRYSEVQIDPHDLSISLTVPERESSVGVEHLSTGTRDLVYMMLHIGISRLMGRTGETLPLLLDDPFVQYDRQRQKQALEYLLQLTEETQVFLFTKDEWAKAWFEDRCASLPSSHLHILD